VKYSIRFLFDLIQGIATLGWCQIYVSFHERVKAHFVKTSGFLKNAALQEKFQSISDDVQNFQTQADYTLNNCFKHIRISEKLVIFPVFFWLAISFILTSLNVHAKDANNILLYFSPLLILSGTAFVYSTLMFPYFINIKIFDLMRSHERLEKKYWELCISPNWSDSYKFLESFQTARFPVLPLLVIWVLLTFIPSAFISLFSGGESLFAIWIVISILGLIILLYFSWFHSIYRRYSYHLENHRNLGFMKDEAEKKEIIPAFKIKKCFTIKNIIAAGLVCVIAAGIFVIRDYIKEAERKRRKEEYRKVMAVRKRRAYEKAKAKNKRKLERK